jgi:hypothetical protein
VSAWVPSLNEIEDGWGILDDPYASDFDNISFANPAGGDSRFTFELSNQDGVYCLEVLPNNDTTSDSAYMMVGGEIIPILNQWGYHEWAGHTVQYLGGIASCAFFYWNDKTCDGFWSDNPGDYAAAGCPVTLDEIVPVTTTDTFGGVEVTCLSTSHNNFVKCQGTNSSSLNDCIGDSRDFPLPNDGGDLASVCNIQNTDDSNYDTEYTCDLDDPSNSWELSFLDNGHLSVEKKAIWSEGFPNTTFRIWYYHLCGIGSFDYGVVDTFTLQQFRNKTRTCTSLTDYDLQGIVRGYKLWYNETLINETTTYGSAVCGSGLTCRNGIETPNEGANPDLNACYDASIVLSCYNNILDYGEEQIDYGGTCGQCDNTSKKDDIYFAVAYESNPKGYFDRNSFDNSIHCVEAEEDIGLAVSIVLFITAMLFAILVLFIVFLTAWLLWFSIPVLLLWRKKLFKRENNAFKYKKN